MSTLFDQTWWPGVASGLIGLAGVLAVALLQTWRERRKDKRSDKTPDPPTTQQVWERLDRVERVLGSTVVLLGEAADQWQGEHPPVFSRRHVAIVAAAGFMPPEWDPELTEGDNT